MSAVKWDASEAQRGPAVSKCIVTTGLTCVLSIAASSEVAGQPLLVQLATLLTEQRPSGTYVPDPAAAAATTSTVAGLFLVELATLPTSSSSAGFTYRFRSDLGLYERVSNEFGPFFTERALRNSRGQASLGLIYQSSTFGSLQGGDLQDGTFPTNASRYTGAIDPFSVDTLRLDFVTGMLTPFFSYGLTDRLDLGVEVPLVTVRFDGERTRTSGGVSTLQSSQSDSATGIGDVTVSGRYLVAGSGVRGVSIGANLRLPTGNQLELLGTDDAAVQALGIGSWEEGQLAVHVNGGIGMGGMSREIFWATATTFAAAPRLTIVGELLGRRLSQLAHLSDVYQPHPVVAGVETMRWLPSERGVHTVFVVTGAKWNVAGSWLLNGNVLFRVTDAGLRATATPSLSIDYGFER
jgi:hypothetical protein